MRFIGFLSAETRVVVSPAGDLLQCGFYLGYYDLFFCVIAVRIQAQVQDNALIVSGLGCKLLKDLRLQRREVRGLSHQLPYSHGRDGRAHPELLYLYIPPSSKKPKYASSSS